MSQSISEQDLLDAVACAYIFNAADAFAHTPHAPKAASTLGRLTVCVLVLKNGFLVTGESCCADANHFDPAEGARLAKIDAMEKLWPLLGYELRTKLYNEQQKQEN